jgi:hypothetical protein
MKHFHPACPYVFRCIKWTSDSDCALQDRYRELLRVSREWRDLFNRIRAGVVHDRPDITIDGGLALFCPACPQMDINIPPELEWKPDDR